MDSILKSAPFILSGQRHNNFQPTSSSSHTSFLSTSWGVLIFLFHLPYLINAQSFDLTYYIDEEVPLNYQVGSIAIDSDISRLLSTKDFQSLGYRLLLYPNTNTGLFSISNKTGVLKTVARIDREVLCHYEIKCTLELHVAAQTESGQQFYTFAVKIYVRDINDNSPSFHIPSSTLVINEDASILTSLPISPAMDRDIGNNTLQSYRLLTNSNEFGLKVSRNLDGSLVPQLFLKSELDREKQSSYIITVLALDGGSPRRSGELVVNVTISDANDNAPMFSQQTYDVSVDEVTSANTAVMTLKAIDRDLGQNGRLIYRLAPRQSEEAYKNFRVAPESGKIYTVRELTPLQGKSLRLVVEAMDHGVKPLISQAEVNIHIRDSVNNPPIIRMTTSPTNPVFHVTEDAEPGFVVTHFVVEDNDSGDNGIVQCHLRNPVFGLQGIKPKEFKVSVLQDLDRERKPFYQVNVTCEDGGQPSLKTSVVFSVLLIDCNDEKPKFSQSVYRTRVPENAKNVVAVRLRAEDKDLGENGHVMYSLGNVTSLVYTYIEINPVSGEVITKKGLDRELFPRLEFQVVATDEGKKPLSSTATVVIEVEDQNDNIPSVPAGYALSIMENLPGGTPIGKIRAIDPDLGKAGQVGYQLLSDNGAARLFNLTADGLVTALRTFDREKRDAYQINVLARDYDPNPRTNILHIKIRITDDNDNAPVFLFPRARNKTAYVTVDVKANTTVTRVQAIDDDYGENATIQYNFEAGRQNLFRIDSRSGRVYTVRNVKRDDRGSYKIRVYIRDTGPIPIPRSSDLVLIVTQGNATAAADVHRMRKSHIIIVAILIAITIIIAVLVFLVVFRFITKDRNRNMRHAKYTGGLPMAVKSRSASPHDENSSSEEGPWRRYDEAKRQQTTNVGPPVRPADVTYDTNDDILMFKMRLADQYRELEPEDKMSANGTLSRDGAESNHTSVLSDMDGGTDVTNSNKTNRLATFQVKATPVYGSHTSSLDKNGGGGIGSVAKIPEEVLSSCSRDLGGTDSGRGTSEDGSQDDSGYPTSPGHVTVRAGTAPRGLGTVGAYSKPYPGSAFDRPPLLMTFQGNNNSTNSGSSGSSSSAHDSPSNSTTLPSRRDFSYAINNKDRPGIGEIPKEHETALQKGSNNFPSNNKFQDNNDSDNQETFLKQKSNPNRSNFSTPNHHSTVPKNPKDFERSINSIKEQINAFLRPKDNNHSNSPKPLVKETRLCSEPFVSTTLHSNNIKPSINSSFTPRGVQETGIPSPSIYATQNGGNPSYNRSNKPLILGGGGGDGVSGGNGNSLTSCSNQDNSKSFSKTPNSSPYYRTDTSDFINNYNPNSNITPTPSTSITNKLNSCPQLYKDSPSKVSLHSLSSQQTTPSTTNNAVNKNKSRSFHNRESPLLFPPSSSRSPLDLMNESLETQDDGNTTTTSGSYTIDHDDLNLDLPSTDVYV